MTVLRRLWVGLLLCGSLGDVRAVDVSAWSRQMTVSFPGYTVTEALTSFPVSVRLNASSISGFSYADFASTNGYDLRFTDSATNAWLNYEFEKWNTGGSSYVWVKIPRLTAGTNILAFWGNPYDPARQPYTTNGATWSSTFAGVWHLNESAGPFRDSTANGNHSFGDAHALPVTGLSALKSARHFDGGQNIPNPTNGYIDFNNSPSLQYLWSGSTGGTNPVDWTSPGELVMTVEFWSRIPATPEQYQRIVSCFSTDGWGIQTLNGHYRYEQNGMGGEGAVYIMDNAWHYCAHTYNGFDNHARLYTDGTLEIDNVTGEVHGYPYGFAIGAGGPPNYYQPTGQGHGNPFNGEVDEVRITKGVRSAAWVRASYLTIASNSSFQAYSAVRTTAQTEPPVAQIPANSPWRYLTDGSDQGTAWRNPDFAAETNWPVGPGTFGYGVESGLVNTPLDYGPDPSNKRTTYYFRKPVNLSDTSLLPEDVTFQANVDDGAILYVNGTPAWHFYMTNSGAGYHTLATRASGDPVTTPYSFTVPRASFVNGTNVIAVELHQGSTNSSDVYFHLWSDDLVSLLPPPALVGGTNSPPAQTNESVWTAYNDFAWSPDQLAVKITKLSFVDDADHDTNGPLLRYSDGQTCGVSVVCGGLPGAALWVTTNIGSPNAGSPADFLFNGKVDMDRTVYFPGSEAGTIAITGMESARRYRVTLLGNRANPDYTNRTTVLTLSGADAFVNASSVGAAISGAQHETTTIVTGTNAVGQVFMYTDIAPGSDGQVLLTVTGNPGITAYLNTMLVQLLPSAMTYDDWATGYFGSPGAPAAGPGNDWDSDGFNNDAEFRAGTDPRRADSRLVVTELAPAGGPGELVLRWAGVTGKNYSVLRTTNLLSPWDALQSGIAGSAPINVYTAAGNAATGFLRVRLD